ncbi:MAG: hypothetical protein WD767_11410 [Alphaproteobacteria bacterium]
MTYRTLLTALAVAFVLNGQVQAAEEWGLPNEKITRFEAKVVDILCELTGDCPKACGEGKRQLGLLDSTGKLVLPSKNSVIFAGAAAELIDFCNATVIADGLLTTNRGHTIFALQFVRKAPDGPWRRANRFLPKWAAENGIGPKSDMVEEWYLHDPRIKAELAANGKLGLGLAADKAYEAKQ